MRRVKRARNLLAARKCRFGHAGQNHFGTGTPIPEPEADESRRRSSSLTFSTAFLAESCLIRPSLATARIETRDPEPSGATAAETIVGLRFACPDPQTTKDSGNRALRRPISSSKAARTDRTSSGEAETSMESSWGTFGRKRATNFEALPPSLRSSCAKTLENRSSIHAVVFRSCQGSIAAFGFSSHKISPLCLNQLPWLHGT